MFAYVGSIQNLKDLKRTSLAGSAAILCTGGIDVIQKEAWSFYRISFGVRLCWEFEELKGPKDTGGLDVIRMEAWSFYRTISGVRLCLELEEPERPNEA